MVNIYNGEELTKPKNEFYRTIADKLKMIRKQKGISQGELAKRLKVSQQAISHIEMGRDNASLLTLKRSSMPWALSLMWRFPAEIVQG